MKFIRIILFPLVPVYHMVTWLRNILYDLDWLKSKSYDLPVICVGNLSTGGTGKTPMIEYLIRLLNSEFHIATLSRGYKRQTEGFILSSDEDDANSIGDEPYQFYSKFPNIMVAVDSNRQNGIGQLLKLPKKPDIILLDDAFQHRKVKAGFNILLTPYQKPYYSDFVLPTGNLREPKSGAKRADIVIVTKCPGQLSENDKTRIDSKLKLNPEQQLFFSHISYPEVVQSFHETKQIKDLGKFTLVTGIANPTPLKEHLIEKSLEFDHLEYPDHYIFKPNDIKVLTNKDIIVTTEKDYMRLKVNEEIRDRLYYLPITLELDKPLDFEKAVRSFLTEEA